MAVEHTRVSDIDTDSEPRLVEWLTRKNNGMRRHKLMPKKISISLPGLYTTEGTP